MKNFERECLPQSSNVDIQKVLDIVEKDMSYDDLFTILNLHADSLKRGTFQLLMSQSSDIEAQREELIRLNEKLFEMDIPKQYLELFETIVARNDELNFDYVAVAYRAGIIDAYRILREFDLTKE